MEMKNRERFHAVMNFKPVDRMPVIEPFVWWNETLKRWYGEGLPKDVNLYDFFGLDHHHQKWIGPGPNKNPEREDGLWDIDSFEKYEESKKYHYPANAINPDEIKPFAALQDKGEIFCWITVEGFFWFPRELFGIQRHLTAFYEYPELMHRINSDLLEYNKRVIEEYCRILKPDWMTIAEDMSFNTGTMIGQDLIREFMKPYYLELLAHARECGVSFIFMDTDGNHSDIISLFHDEIGLDGFVPFERNSGLNLALMRSTYRKLRVIGGFEKRAMFGTEEELISEFETALPALKTGGIILGCDHQTPPQVSIDQYRRYVRYLNEYARKVSE